MKTETKTPPAKQARLPKGRVMRADPYLLNAYTFRLSADKHGIVPSPDRTPAFVVVLPCPTQKAARAVVALHNMNASQLEELMLTECTRQEKAEDEGWEPGRIDIVRGYLNALGLGARRP